MNLRDFLDLPAIRARMLEVRRRSLGVVSGVLAIVYLTDSTAGWGLLLVATSLGAAVGWWAQPTTRNLEALLMYDLVVAYVAWFVLSPAAGIAFLVILVALLGSMLLPPRAALRLMAAALAIEVLRIPVHVSKGFGLLFYQGGTDVATTDFLVGMGVRSAVLIWGAGLVRTIVAMVSDAVRATDASERRFRAAFEDAPIGMGLFDSNGRVVRLNPTFEALSGQVVGALALSDLLAVADRDVAMHSVRWAAANPGRRVDIECETRGNDGNRRLVSLSLVGIEEADPGGTDPLVLAQARDVTEQRQAERGVARRLEIEGVIRSVSTYLVEVPVEETDKAIEQSLKILGEYLGADRALLAGGTDDEGAERVQAWCRAGCADELQAELTALDWRGMDWLLRPLREGKSVVIDNLVEIADDQGREFLGQRGSQAFLAVPVPLPDGGTGFLALERQRPQGGWTEDHSGLAWVVGELLSHALRRHADQLALERLLQSKGEFVARVSHELRTPMTVVLGLAEELVNAGRVTDRDEAEELLRLIVDQSRELSLIVEDLLVAARLDLGTLTIRPDEVNLAREVRLAWSGAAAPGIELELDVAESITAWADPLRVRQIIRNLLTNAARYGGKRVRVEAQETPESVILVVADDGPGVPEEEAERIFEPYIQAANTKGMPAAMGLGLSVSRSLARLMGGDVTYRRADEWTRFEVSLRPVGARD